jgi:LPPG:FO 2-phospho-L-lactate transferase
VLERRDLAGVVICPSNPLLSVDPILAVDGVRDALMRLDMPVVAVSPLVGGRAIKGPLTKLLGELGKPLSNASIVEHYDGLVDHLIIDEADAAEAAALRERGIEISVTRTVMQDAADQERLARETLAAIADTR